MSDDKPKSATAATLSFRSRYRSVSDGGGGEGEEEREDVKREEEEEGGGLRRKSYRRKTLGDLRSRWTRGGYCEWANLIPAATSMAIFRRSDQKLSLLEKGEVERRGEGK